MSLRPAWRTVMITRGTETYIDLREYREVRKLLSEAGSRVSELEAQVNQLVKERDSARVLLKERGHTHRCSCHIQFGDCMCDCGLDEALGLVEPVGSTGR